MTAMKFAPSRIEGTDGMATANSPSTAASTVRLRAISASFESTLQSIGNLGIYERSEAVAPRRLGVAVGPSFPARVWIGGRGIRQGIPVDLRTGDGEIVAAVGDDVPVFGVGTTFVEAIEDLRAALSDHLQLLNATDELTDDLRSQRDYLRLRLAL
jgi:hypothetical protein